MFFSSVRHRGVLSGAVLAPLLSTNLPAQQQPRSLTLGEALARTAAQNPELGIRDFEVDAQEGRVHQAEALLDAQRTLHEAAADAHGLRIEFERLAGTALSGNAIP